MNPERNHNENDLGWCVLELMGHRRLAGQVQSVELASAPFLRIDIRARGRGTVITGR